MDPLRRVRAWQSTAALVESEREKLAAEGKPVFIIAEHYGITGLLTFYSPPARAALKSEPLVYCVDSDEPENQFYFWPEYNYRDSRQGQERHFCRRGRPLPARTRLVLEMAEATSRSHRAGSPPPLPLPPRIVQEFESVTDLGECEIKYGDRVFHRVHLWACYNLS